MSIMNKPIILYKLAYIDNSLNENSLKILYFEKQFKIVSQWKILNFFSKLGKLK